MKKVPAQQAVKLVADPISIPNPLHPLLPPLRDSVLFRALQMASDGQVEEKPEKRGPSPIETAREWEHLPPRQGKCGMTGGKAYYPVDQIPEPCDNCGDDYISRGVVERDVETGDIYRRDGKAVPREKS